MATVPDVPMDEQTPTDTTNPAPPTASAHSTTVKIQPLDLFGSETVNCLSSGFLSALEPELVRVRQSLDELV